MSEILLFGGTTEGRELADFLCEKEIETDVSVVTDYGAELLPESSFIHKLTGRKDLSEMEKLVSENEYRLIIDATHPYAVEVTENIKSVCTKHRLNYIRVVRDETSDESGNQYDSIDEIAEYLNNSEGTILSTFGSKEISALTGIKEFEKRLWVRILDSEKMIEYCRNSGIPETHIIAGKGPFSVEENIAHIKQSGAVYLLTKESGKTGGFTEKVRASELCGIEILVLKRPKESGYSIEEAKKIIISSFKKEGG